MPPPALRARARRAPLRRGAARLAPLLLALVVLTAAPRLITARAVDINFEAKPIQLGSPWSVAFSWNTPTKTGWPTALTYTATDGGTSYFTITVTRSASVTSGQLQGALTVTRTAADQSGPPDKSFSVNGPSVELWQANGPGQVIARVASAPCVFDGGGSTFVLTGPGVTGRCTYTFSPPFSYDPEQKSELRVSQVGHRRLCGCCAGLHALCICVGGADCGRGLRFGAAVRASRSRGRQAGACALAKRARPHGFQSTGGATGLSAFIAAAGRACAAPERP